MNPSDIKDNYPMQIKFTRDIRFIVKLKKIIMIIFE